MTDHAGRAQGRVSLSRKHEAIYLREKADHLRSLAGEAGRQENRDPLGIALLLERLADEFELRAREIERELVAHSPLDR